MSTRGRGWWGLVLLMTGCASAPGDYGKHARFSPALQGYVMARDEGSDDPDKDEPVIVLVDPLTGKKLRCREDVEGFRELFEDIAVDRAHDDNVATTVGVTTGAVFGPLIALQPVGGLVLAEAMLVSDLLYDDLSSETGPELLARGIALWKRERWAQAAAAIERALAKDPGVGVLDKAALYLGLSYDKLGQKARAALALERFLDHALVRDVSAYREAATALKRLGVSRPKCASIEPVELRWPQ